MMMAIAEPAINAPVTMLTGVALKTAWFAATTIHIIWEMGAPPIMN
jgi:hypothetical protein